MLLFSFLLLSLFHFDLSMHLFVRAYFFITSLQKLAPWLVRVLIPFVIITRSTAERAGSISKIYVTATTTTATIHTRQSVCIAQWLLGEGLVSPVALEATLRFPLVLVTPVKFSFTCCKRYHRDKTDIYVEKKKKIFNYILFIIVRSIWKIYVCRKMKEIFRVSRVGIGGVFKRRVIKVIWLQAQISEKLNKTQTTRYIVTNFI